MATLSRDRFRAYSQAIDAAVAFAIEGLRDELAPLVEEFAAARDDAPRREELRERIIGRICARGETGVLMAQAEADDLFRSLSEEGGWGALPAAHEGFNAEAAAERFRSAVGHIFEDGNDYAFYRAIEDHLSKKVTAAPTFAMCDNVGWSGVEKLFWASVPNGATTCKLCIAIAANGFHYKSNVDNRWHANCRCRSIPGVKGHDAVEGYDPAFWEDAWDMCQKVDMLDLGETEKKAVRTAWFDARELYAGEGTAKARENADAYQAGMDAAWKRFRKDKTEKNYEQTVGVYLQAIGDSAGIDLSGEFMARPDGDEIWAVLKVASNGDAAKFKYATTESRSFDLWINGENAEIKTPKGVRHLNDHLSKAGAQLPSHPKISLLSLLRYEDEFEYPRSRAKAFTGDGTLDAVKVVDPDGKVESIEKGRHARASAPSPGGNTPPYASYSTESPMMQGTGSLGLDIEIDSFVPCLVRVEDNIIVNTVVTKVEKRSELKGYNKKTGWYINWQNAPRDTEIYKLQVEGSDTIEGLVSLRLRDDAQAVEGVWAVAAPHNRGTKAEKKYDGVGGHLFAILAKRSFDAGYNGYIFGRAKTDGVLRHYIEKFNAVQISGSRDFCIEEEASRKLLEKYKWKTRE